MANRGRVHHRTGFHDGGRRAAPYPDPHEPNPYPRGPLPSRPPPPAVYEDEIEFQRVELRRLLADNRRLSDNCAGLQRELSMAKEEIHRLNVVTADIRADKDAQMRDLVDKGLKMEADLRALEPLRAEVEQLRGNLQKLNGMRQEQVQGLTQELSRAQADAKQAIALKAELDGLRQELVRVRGALEYEKKGNAELIEQRQAMEKNLVSMAREVEKLRAEVAGSDPRSWAGGGGYGLKVNSPDRGYPSYGDGYTLPTGSAEKAPLYGMTSGSWGGYEKSRLPRR